MTTSRRGGLATLIVVGVSAAWGGLAHGQDRGTADDQRACEPDVWRLCTVAIPDEQAIVACLNARARDLSPACRGVIAPAREVRKH